MVKIMDIPNSRGRNGFWEAYRACAEENRVRPDRSPFYVNWAKDFANFLPQKPLRDRSRKDVEAFLANLGKRRGIADWQVQQAQHALKILMRSSCLIMRLKDILAVPILKTAPFKRQ